MVDGGNFVLKVRADRAVVCSRNALHREIRTDRYCPEVEVGLQARNPLGDKAGLRVGDKAGD